MQRTGPPQLLHISRAAPQKKVGSPGQSSLIPVVQEAYGLRMAAEKNSAHSWTLGPQVPPEMMGLPARAPTSGPLHIQLLSLECSLTRLPPAWPCSFLRSQLQCQLRSEVLNPNLNLPPMPQASLCPSLLTVPCETLSSPSPCFIQ
jgi:hypothetical protein